MSSVANAILQANPDVPRNGEFAKHLARKLYPPAKQRDDTKIQIDFLRQHSEFEAADIPQVETCGEYLLGVLDVALASTLIPREDKEEIEDMISDSAPALEKTKTIDHFRFHWTEVSPNADDNVNEANIDATGVVLNDMWDRYSADFREPRADLVGGVRLLDVNVYFQGHLHGSTSSFRNEIFLNSRTVVRDNCRRNTTSAHELFHRVEYSYGYVTGTPNQKWWVEALGSWSQQYAYPAEHDYVGRVNRGLETPNFPVLARSYDACHFWKFFGERLVAGGHFPTEHEALVAFLDEYNANGLDAKDACDTVWKTANTGESFDALFAAWATVNFSKDFVGVPNGYADNSRVVTQCARTHGPYAQIMPDHDENIDSDGQKWDTGKIRVLHFGTNYHRFRLGSAVTQVGLRFGATPPASLFAVELLLVKGDQYRSVRKHLATSSESWDLNVSNEDIDGVIAVVSSLTDPDGEYVLAVNNSATEHAALLT